MDVARVSQRLPAYHAQGAVLDYAWGTRTDAAARRAVPRMSTCVALDESAAPWGKHWRPSIFPMSSLTEIPTSFAGYRCRALPVCMAMLPIAYCSQKLERRMRR